MKRVLPFTTLAGILLVAAAATLADWVWYTFGVRHDVAAGLIHGALLLTVVGGVLGAAAGRTLKGLPIGAVGGIGGALAYYVIVALVDDRPYGAAIPASWVAMWLLMSLLEGRWLRAAAPRPWLEILVRGVAAALLGGVAFYLVVGTLWGAPPESGRNYLRQFAAWAVAWTPGLLALTAGRVPARSP